MCPSTIHVYMYAYIVLFHPLTARYMYEWHIGQKMWDAISISYDSIAENEQLFSHEVDFVQRLIDISEKEPETVRKKQEALKGWRISCSSLLLSKAAAAMAASSKCPTKVLRTRMK